jgi:hypothetical protein
VPCHGLVLGFSRVHRLPLADFTNDTTLLSKCDKALVVSSPNKAHFDAGPLRKRDVLLRVLRPFVLVFLEQLAADAVRNDSFGGGGGGLVADAVQKGSWLRAGRKSSDNNQNPGTEVPGSAEVVSRRGAACSGQTFIERWTWKL